MNRERTEAIPIRILRLGLGEYLGKDEWLTFEAREDQEGSWGMDIYDGTDNPLAAQLYFEDVGEDAMKALRDFLNWVYPDE